MVGPLLVMFRIENVTGKVEKKFLLQLPVIEQRRISRREKSLKIG